jgi:alkylhydroperoxidase family enzyme
LPEGLKTAIRVTDAVVTDPAGVSDDVRAALLAELPPGDVVELVLTVALASAFSRAAITWGPPADMPTIDVPTPTPDPADRR